MKPSVAFYSTIEWVTELTSYIFSFGYDRHSGATHFLLYPLFFTGELASYVIGYPLGILAGGVAASVVFFANLFKTKGCQVPNSPALTPAALTPIVESVSTEVSAPIVVPTAIIVPTSVVSTPTLSDEEILKATVQRKKIQEKQTSLRTKNQLLGTRIDQEILSLSAQCQAYEAHKDQISALKNRLASEEGKQHHATKHDGFRIETKSEFSLLRKYHYPNNPLFWYVTKETRVPNVVIDYQARRSAADQCCLLTQQINDLGTMAPPAAYHARVALLNLKDRLGRLRYNSQTDADLSVQRAAYITVLNEVASILSNDPEFSVADFKPTSKHATCAYVSFWIKRLPETLCLPEELKDYIVLSAASDLSKRDARDIYRTCP